MIVPQGAHRRVVPIVASRAGANRATISCEAFQTSLRM
jgi:hypothetical protein